MCHTSLLTNYCFCTKNAFLKMSLFTGCVEKIELVRFLFTYPVLSLCSSFYSCLSDQVPPLFGKRSDICYKGVQPRTNAEIKNATFLSTKGNWTIYLVVGIFTTMLVTAITTTAIFCFCCSDNIGKMRTVSPT